jgi:hypothetical protein
MKKVILGLGIGIFIASCSSISLHGKSLTPSQLNDNPTRYNGKFVEVRGFVTLAPEGHVLYESQALSAEFKRGWKSGSRAFDVRKYEKYCLTIANPGLLYKNRASVNGKTITVRGKFIDNYLDGTVIDLGACPLPTAIVVDDADLERRYGSLLPER